MRFEFATATRIIFGPGTLAEAAPEAVSLGRQPLLVTGGSSRRAEPLLELLQRHSLLPARLNVPGEPTTQLAQEGVRLAREAGCDFIIAMGGGSAIDAGKAIAALLTNGGEPLDYLEVIGRGQPITRRAAPLIAIPTTAGTGAEVTRNAVLKASEQQVKVSLRSPLMLPSLAIVDPELTHSVPPAVTASTGLDALTQVMEPFVSSKANPLIDGICKEGLRLVAGSLRRAYEAPEDAVARQDMALASLFGGLALANAGLGAVHGFAGPIGGMFPAPHGVICARLLPIVMEANVQALQSRQPDHPALKRYDEIARILTGRSEAVAGDGVAWVRSLCDRLNVPPLGEYGIVEADFPEIVAKSQQASSMKGNPLKLSDEELTAILRQAV